MRVIQPAILSLIFFQISSSFAAEHQILLQQIMADPDWIGRFPENPVWSADGSRILFQRKREGSEIRDWWHVDVESGKPKKLSLKAVAKGDHVPGQINRQHTRRIFAFDGDLFLQNLATGSVVQITRTESSETSPAFLHKEDQIQFRRDGKLFVRNLESGLEWEPVVLRFENAPDEEQKEKGFVAEKEHQLFRYLQKEQKAKDAAKLQKKNSEQANPFDVDEPFFLGKEKQLRSQELSPNGMWLAVITSKKDARQTGRSDKMPVWIQEDGYAASRDVRSLVGTNREGNDTLVLLDLKKHRIVDVDLKKLPGIRKDPLKFLRKSDSEKSAKDDSPKKPPQGSKPNRPKTRDINIRSVAFSADSKFVLFQCYSTDNKDRWVCTLRLGDKKSAKVRVIEHRHDPAWINWRANIAGWVKETRQVYFVSEKTGYAHLYVADAKQGKPRALTSGEFEVSSVKISRDGKRIFFRSNATHPGVYELSVVKINNGKIRQLTSLGGVNEFEMSPDERFAVALHSRLNRPPQLVLADFSNPEEEKVLADFTSKKFRAIDWTVPEIVRVPARHGRTVNSRLYLPKTKDKKRRPAVIFVHGAGYMQNAHLGWSYYFREFMFHTLLNERGYVVLDMDYRASAGYGRDWRTAIYRQMGTPELEDLEDGVDWLIREHRVDRKRIGVYGGSYGGFMTMMALFKNPGMFACGAALRPVTDWAHYNHGYTSNILNTPDIDPAAYERSSPIYYAEGLQDPLLICHGMLDDNVFFKDTVRLAQKLIELEKQNWQVAIYPVEPHGFRQPSSWLDEYRRVFQLFETHLQDD